MGHRGKSILIGLSFVIVSLPLYALSFGPCGGGYVTLVPGAILFIIGAVRLITAVLPERLSAAFTHTAAPRSGPDSPP